MLPIPQSPCLVALPERACTTTLALSRTTTHRPCLMRQVLRPNARSWLTPCILSHREGRKTGSIRNYTTVRSRHDRQKQTGGPCRSFDETDRRVAIRHGLPLAGRGFNGERYGEISAIAVVDHSPSIFTAVCSDQHAKLERPAPLPAASGSQTSRVPLAAEALGDRGGSPSRFPFAGGSY